MHARVARFWPLVGAIVALALTALLTLVLMYREHDKPFGFELEWMSELVERRSEPVTFVALVFDSLGGGWIAVAVVPIGVVLALVLWRRRWAALYFLTATVAAAALVQAVKQLVGRSRPVEILVTSDFGSFPSGHSANAALIATTLGIVFARRGVWIAGALYTLAMMVSRTYLGAHWISDTVGGVLIGSGVAVIVWAPLAARLFGERRLPHPPPWQPAR